MPTAALTRTQTYTCVGDLHPCWISLCTSSLSEDCRESRIQMGGVHPPPPKANHHTPWHSSLTNQWFYHCELTPSKQQPHVYASVVQFQAATALNG
mmetsp:Transcript_16138/g.28607  ORF Transcript_16138/g.28607 Transcript_16138/m.28607 type:complete len:96 (+) Transcript_16138:1921-2208(+)